jgi:hypothetical protein
LREREREREKGSKNKNWNVKGFPNTHKRQKCTMWVWSLILLSSSLSAEL